MGTKKKAKRAKDAAATPVPPPRERSGDEMPFSLVRCISPLEGGGGAVLQGGIKYAADELNLIVEAMQNWAFSDTEPFQHVLFGVRERLEVLYEIAKRVEADAFQARRARGEVA